MKRPIVFISVCFISGIIIAYVNPNLYFFLIFSAIFITGGYVLSKRVEANIYCLLLTYLFLLFGFIWYTYKSDLIYNKFSEFNNKNVKVYGCIDSDIQYEENKIVFILKTNSIDDGITRKNTVGKIRVTVYLQNKYTQGVKSDSVNIKNWTNETSHCPVDVTFHCPVGGKITLPSGIRNPGSFDYRSYLAQKNISALLITNDFEAKEWLNNIDTKYRKDNLLINIGRILRQKIIVTINKVLPKQQAALLNGMLIGYTQDLGKEVEDIFRDAGLSHIMAVSGANVAFIVLPILFICKKLKIPRTISNVFAGTTVLVFVCITGFDASIVRAAIMAWIVLLAQVLRRDADIYNSLGLSALIILLINPFNLFNIGFLLSFSATLGIVLFYKNIEKVIPKAIPKIIRETAAATIAAQLGVTPVTVYFFNNFSVVSLLSNILVVPMTGIVTVLGLVMAIVGQISEVMARLIGYINCSLLSLILIITKWCSSFPWSNIKVITPTILFIIMYYLFVVFFLCYKPYKNIKLKLSSYMVLTLVVSCIYVFSIIFNSAMEIWFIDVGQGDACLIKTPSGYTALIDGGERDGEDLIIPFLFDMRVHKLDMVIATHGHKDHIYGLIDVLENFKVKTLVIPSLNDEGQFTPIIDKAKEKNIEIKRVSMGDELGLNHEVSIKAILPKNTIKVDKDNWNNNSLIVKVDYGSSSFLFTGDAEINEIEQLLDTNFKLNCDVIKVPHHGSPNGYCQELLMRVNPKAAIISVGKNNFGHPDEGVLKNYSSNNIEVLRTDLFGCIRMKVLKNRIKIFKTIYQ